MPPKNDIWRFSLSASVKSAAVRMRPGQHRHDVISRSSYQSLSLQTTIRHLRRVHDGGRKMPDPVRFATAQNTLSLQRKTHTYGVWLVVTLKTCAWTQMSLWWITFTFVAHYFFISKVSRGFGGAETQEEERTDGTWLSVTGVRSREAKEVPGSNSVWWY